MSEPVLTARLAADHVADQRTSAVLEAQSEITARLLAGDIEGFGEALIKFGTASYEAGWDQCHADLRAVYAEVGIELP